MKKGDCIVYCPNTAERVMAFTTINIFYILIAIAWSMLATQKILQMIEKLKRKCD
jgi:glutaredoxin-related protein